MEDKSDLPDYILRAVKKQGGVLIGFFDGRSAQISNSGKEYHIVDPKTDRLRTLSPSEVTTAWEAYQKGLLQESITERIGRGR